VTLAGFSHRSYTRASLEVSRVVPCEPGGRAFSPPAARGSPREPANRDTAPRGWRECARVGAPGRAYGECRGTSWDVTPTGHEALPIRGSWSSPRDGGSAARKKRDPARIGPGPGIPGWRGRWSGRSRAGGGRPRDPNRATRARRFFACSRIPVRRASELMSRRVAQGRETVEREAQILGESEQKPSLSSRGRWTGPRGAGARTSRRPRKSDLLALRPAAVCAISKATRPPMDQPRSL